MLSKAAFPVRLLIQVKADTRALWEDRGQAVKRNTRRDIL